MLRRSFQLLNNRFIGMTGGDVIREKLSEYKIGHVFGYCGGCNLPILNGFYGSDYPKFMGACTELGAGFMATGYAKTKNIPGVAITTSGPGMTNALTALYDANADHVPLIVLSGQVTTSALGTDAFQEAPAINMAKPVTKWVHQLQDINHLPSVMDHAYKIAMNDVKGAVFIDLPKDLMVKTVTGPYDIDTEYKYKYVTTNNFVLDSDIDKVAELIKKAKRPIIFAGQGAKHCYKLVRIIAQRANIPVTTSLHGLGIFDENHQYSLKMVGMHGSAAANFALQEADLIIGIGVRFDDRTIGTIGTYAPKAHEAYNRNEGGIISINLDRLKTIKPHFDFNYDCKKFLGLLYHKIVPQNRDEWINHIVKLKQDNPFRYKYEDNVIKTQDVLIALNKKLSGKEFIVSTGVGNHQQFASMYITFNKPNRFLTSGSAGTMGVCLPYLVGSYYAYRDSKHTPLLIGIDGDGSFNMTMNELQHIARYNVPVKIFIMNDKQLQMVATWQDLFFDGRIIATDSYNPNYSMLGNAWGIRVVKIRNRKELKDALKLITSPEPIIFDCQVTSTYCLPLVAPGKALDDMILYQDDLLNTNFDKVNAPA